MRQAILDSNRDGRFDERDVSALAKAVLTPAQPGRRDWSHADLNGDGFTGGDTTAPFDLDTTGSTRAGAARLGTVTQSIAGRPVDFDEHQVTDTQILCYYSYSPLYPGSPTTRDAALVNACAPR